MRPSKNISTWNVLNWPVAPSRTWSQVTAARSASCFQLTCPSSGGENQSNSGRLALALAEPLLAGDPAAAEALLDQKAVELDAADGGSAQAASTLRPVLAPLRAICRGSRDPALADTEGLDYSMAAEIRLLIERLT